MAADMEKHSALGATQPHSNLEVNEKATAIHSDVVSSQNSSNAHDYDDLPDPDAGKSEEERAKLVRLLLLVVFALGYNADIPQ